ncbi:class I SAM-dependent DNA methyltransferase [Niveispirillum sp. KHB5.9]|uniref:class I SAM-dependent DNA methyltransferase n=1 Tax=Niveispirillum sp. KHB5.9 TaxID=3400269 RepID=UPI003A8B37CC
MLDAPPIDALQFLPVLAEATRLTPSDDIAGTLALADILLMAKRHIAVLGLLSRPARQWTGVERVQAELLLARSWQGIGSIQTARRAYETASRLAPSLDLGPALAALAEVEATSVQSLFDVFADSFDEKLLGTLGYAIPGMLGGLLAELGVGDGLSILDMGCGTGLCAPSLAPRAARLDGCDLSLNMLEKAAQRGGYSHLWWGDLLDVLSSWTAAWDLAVATDVLLYIPDIEPLFARMATALRPGGHFIFSVLTPAGDVEVERRADGHHHHSDAYISRLIGQSGLSVSHWQEITPRYENKQPLEGRLVVARRP